MEFAFASHRLRIFGPLCSRTQGSSAELLKRATVAASPLSGQSGDKPGRGVVFSRVLGSGAGKRRSTSRSWSFGDAFESRRPSRPCGAGSERGGERPGSTRRELRASERNSWPGQVNWGQNLSLLVRPRMRSQQELIQHLQRMGVVRSARVAHTLQLVDRAHFVGRKNLAYDDCPQSIGFNATISAPHMHAECLELLEPFLLPGSHALDVGSGTGFLTACFAVMVGEKGKAVGLEHIPELVEMSKANVQACPASLLVFNSGVLELHAADGRKGWPVHGPYQAIHVGAAAAEVPAALIEQLAVGGRMVIPVGTHYQDLRVIDKLEDGAVREFVAASVRYVPLTDKKSQLRGA